MVEDKRVSQTKESVLQKINLIELKKTDGRG